ncbi:MAG: hypothetical protein Q8R00_05045 [Candidatus Nanoarchaeia archaeon]|nr:hypothetical protein [Candidatus Nanoarchaeia archaeon]
MPQFKTNKEIFTECESNGFFTQLEEIDSAKIRHMVSLALADLEGAKYILPLTKTNNYAWSLLYKMHYDAFHQLAEAFLRLNKFKCNNHQCLFAYICKKHSELEFDWGFLEKVRTKRNGIQYYGEPVTQENWKEINISIKLYINAIKKAIEEKLKINK